MKSDYGIEFNATDRSTKFRQRLFIPLVILGVSLLANGITNPVEAKGELKRLKNLFIEGEFQEELPELSTSKLFFETELLSDGTDLDRLSYAVAMAETKNCEVKTNFTVRGNCHGLILSNGIAYFPSTEFETSHDQFKDIWKRMYGRFPDYNLAVKYTGGDRAKDWLRIVNYYY